MKKLNYSLEEMEQYLRINNTSSVLCHTHIVPTTVSSLKPFKITRHSFLKPIPNQGLGIPNTINNAIFNINVSTNKRSTQQKNNEWREGNETGRDQQRSTTRRSSEANKILCDNATDATFGSNHHPSSESGVNNIHSVKTIICEKRMPNQMVWLSNISPIKSTSMPKHDANFTIVNAEDKEEEIIDVENLPDDIMRKDTKILKISGLKQFDSKKEDKRKILKCYTWKLKKNLDCPEQIPQLEQRDKQLALVKRHKEKEQQNNGDKRAYSLHEKINTETKNVCNRNIASEKPQSTESVDRECNIANPTTLNELTIDKRALTDTNIRCDSSENNMQVKVKNTTKWMDTSEIKRLIKEEAEVRRRFGNILNSQRDIAEIQKRIEFMRSFVNEYEKPNMVSSDEIRRHNERSKILFNQILMEYQQTCEIPTMNTNTITVKQSNGTDMANMTMTTQTIKHPLYPKTEPMEFQLMLRFQNGTMHVDQILPKILDESITEQQQKETSTATQPQQVKFPERLNISESTVQETKDLEEECRPQLRKESTHDRKWKRKQACDEKDEVVFKTAKKRKIIHVSTRKKKALQARKIAKEAERRRMRDSKIYFRDKKGKFTSKPKIKRTNSKHSKEKDPTKTLS